MIVDNEILGKPVNEADARGVGLRRVVDPADRGPVGAGPERRAGRSETKAQPRNNRSRPASTGLETAFHKRAKPESGPGKMIARNYGALSYP